MSLNAIMHAPGRRDRIVSALATILCEALLLYALLAGLRVVPPNAVGEAMKVFDVGPPPPPPAVEPPPPPRPAQAKPKEEEGAASPANIRSKATEVVAPKAVPLIPPPVVAAPKPDIGDEATKGAAAILGPGTGSGGSGEGSGSGRRGSGPGGGGGDGSPPIHISGRLRNSDYPRSALYAGNSGTVTVIVTIEPSGRVSRCDVYESSGVAELDETTCRLVQQRYRYRPARDEYGRPVRAREIQNHSWVMQFDRRAGM